MFACLLMVLGACWGGEGESPVGSPGHNGMLWSQGMGSCRGVWGRVLLGFLCWSLGKALCMPRIVLLCHVLQGIHTGRREGQTNFPSS